MSQFRKKPVVIEAFKLGFDAMPDWFMDRVSDNTIITSGGRGIGVTWCEITTLEGIMRGDPGDWIIRGVKGEIYPCRDDIFHATYEAVDAAYPMTQAPSDERLRDHGFFLVARPQTERGPGGCMCAIIEVHLPNGEVRLGRAEATTTCPVHGK